MADQDSQLLLRTAPCEQVSRLCSSQALAGWLGCQWLKVRPVLWCNLYSSGRLQVRWHPCLAVSSILSSFLHILSSESVSLVSHEQCRSYGRCGFDPWVGKIPWRRSKWHPIPVYLPGKSHGQRNLAGYRQSRGSQLSPHMCMQNS